MSEFNQIVFGKKTFSDMLKDIDANHTKTEKQITELINALKPFITSPGEAVLIVPLIAKYMEVKVQNDEHLIKMAAIVQRAIQANKKNDNGDTWLSPADLEQIHGEIKKLGDTKPVLQIEPIPEVVTKKLNDKD
jgi:hypothetical protein